MRWERNGQYPALLCVLFAGFVVGGLAAASSSGHPRLILTPQKITALKSQLTTTHAHLWKAALESADEFAETAIPEMENAHNRYRLIGDTLPVLGLAYHMTGDTRYVDAAEKWLSALLAVPTWKGSGNLGRASWSIGSAQVYDWLYDVLDPDIRVRIKERLLAEGAAIIEDPKYWRALSNHLLIETAALGMIGLAFQGEADEAEAYLDQADKWAGFIIKHAPRDGSWPEGVMYWRYGLSNFIRYMEAARTAGYKDYYPEYDWLKLCGYYPIYSSLPGRPLEMINIADSRAEVYMPACLPYLLAARYRNGHYQDYGDKVGVSERPRFMWFDLVSYDPSVSPSDIYTLPTLKHFPDSDYVTMRAGWHEGAMAIGFRCGPGPGHRNQKDLLRVQNRWFGPGHQHPDINSFCIFAYGQWLAIDPGYTKLKLTRNHNTVLVNGLGQAGAGDKWLDYEQFGAREPAPAILRVESNPVYDYVLGDAGNIYVDEAALTGFRRHLLFLKPDIVVVADDLEAKKPSQFEWLLNARESITQIDPDHFEIVRNGVRLWINPLLPDTGTAEIQERALEEASDLDGKILTLDLKVDSARKTRYLVVLCALEDAATEPPRVNLDGNTLEISHQARSWQIKVHDAGHVAQPSDPVLTVTAPRPSSAYGYCFIRDL